MEKEFVSYEIAIALEELGVGFPYIAWYLPNNPMLILHPASMTTTDIPAPLKQQVFRWFREKYRLYSTIIFRVSMEDNNEYWDWLIKGEEVVYRHFKTYEEAENACIDKLIELAKQQDK